MGRNECSKGMEKVPVYLVNTCESIFCRNCFNLLKLDYYPANCIILIYFLHYLHFTVFFLLTSSKPSKSIINTCRRCQNLSWWPSEIRQTHQLIVGILFPMIYKGLGIPPRWSVSEPSIPQPRREVFDESDVGRRQALRRVVGWYGGHCFPSQLHPWRLTWNIVMEVWKIIFPF